MPRSMVLSALLAAVTALSAAPSQAQPFDPGPAGTPVGSSMSGARIAPVPHRRTRGIPNADVFGDTVEERTYGRDYDNSYLTPRIPNVGRDRDVPSELRATEGRSDLNAVNAGAFARGGPTAIGRSSVTRGSAFGGPRAVIVPNKRKK
ncbi:hypothetical protein [Mangrovicella endophytica]|uniref:hypothetical protein n=1 Tax=Mangrovicella endophytica TaxID=2066697 RepID=UPI000C9DCD91|nr:hypothetical protein [Mangrovicella endophytica]